MSSNNLKITFHYGEQDFQKLLEDLIIRRLTGYLASGENDGSLCYNKDDNTTAVHSKNGGEPYE
jgi:hypothetical protein